MSSSSVRLPTVALLLAFLVPLSAQEQSAELMDVTESPDARLERAVWELEVSGRSQYIFGSDLDGPSESIDVWSNRIDLRARGPVWRGALLELGVNFEHREYEFDGRNTFFAGSNQPWSSVNSIGLRAMLLQALGGNWGGLVLFDGRASAEYDAELTDGLSAFTMVGVGSQCSDNFRAGLGVALLARFEEDLLVFPGLYLDWQIDDEWRFALFGPRAQLSYEPEPAWEFELSIGFDGRRFRLSDEGPKNDGIAQEFRLPLALTATWKGVENLEVGLTVGVDLLREYRISDRDGNNERTWDADPGAFIGLSAAYTF